MTSPADLAQLANHIPDEYDPAEVARKLGASISAAVKAVLVEHNYTDKDYRSTYYNFYSKKGQRYRADCVRLHFFDGTVTFDKSALKLRCADNQLADHYFGFVVLRPTVIATIGRSVVSPDVRSGACRFIISADHKVHLLGYRLTVQGFPSMDQHIDISVCAHVACWSILRHYSERYSLYREFLTHDITMMAQEFNPGGLVPSKGLEVSHAERVFQAAGTFPVHVARGPKGADPSFYRQLAAYVDSGFPLFAAMHGRGHAIAVVGYEWRPPSAANTPGMRYAWDEMRALAVVDDNYLPYLSISLAAGGGSPYSAEDVDAFIVALPEKVYYPADAIDRVAPALFRLGSVIGWRLASGRGPAVRVSYQVTTLRHPVRGKVRGCRVSGGPRAFPRTLPMSSGLAPIHLARTSLLFSGRAGCLERSVNSDVSLLVPCLGVVGEVF